MVVFKNSTEIFRVLLNQFPVKIFHEAKQIHTIIFLFACNRPRFSIPRISLIATDDGIHRWRPRVFSTHDNRHVFPSITVCQSRAKKTFRFGFPFPAAKGNFLAVFIPLSVSSAQVILNLLHGVMEPWAFIILWFEPPGTTLTVSARRYHTHEFLRGGFLSAESCVTVVCDGGKSCEVISFLR